MAEILKQNFDLIEESDLNYNSNCDLPWFELAFFWDERVGCCCYYQGKYESWNFSDKKDFIEDFWNGSTLQNIRQSFVTNSIKNSPCFGCYYPKYLSRGASRYLTIPPKLNEIQLKNWKNAINNFNNKMIKVDSYPVRYYFQFGAGCNLNCIMCCQREARKNERTGNTISINIITKKIFDSCS